MPAIWRLTPWQSIAAECEWRGSAAVVSGCIGLLQGRHDVDDALLLALGGPAAQAVLDGQAGGRTGYWPAHRVIAMADRRAGRSRAIGMYPFGPRRLAVGNIICP